MNRIVQIVPELRTGSGVEAVAHHLEREWTALGVETARFTLAEAGGAWLPAVGPGLRGKLALAARVVWFSTIGTLRARKLLARRAPDTVVLCHNDVMAGDVYVSHGIVVEAMRARGNPVLRMARNPLHVFVWLRDSIRYAGRTHDVVVNLCGAEEEALRRTYRRIRPRTEIIGNGVDTEHYRPDPRGRSETRAALGLDPDADVAVFVGHEYGRKGLPLVLAALAEMPGLMLVVVGGTPDMVRAAEADAAGLGIAGQVRFVGRQQDPRPWLHASDVFVFPSAYEAYPLVVLEALACGLPVVATPVGCVPDVLVDGVNGVVVRPDARSVRDGIERCLAGDREAQSREARRVAESRSWAVVAQQYLKLFDTLPGRRP